MSDVIRTRARAHTPQATERRPMASCIGRRLLLSAFVVLFVGYVIGPVLWVLSSSMQTEAEIVSVPPHWLPDKPSVDNFKAIFFYDDARVTYESRRRADPALGEFVPSAARNLVPALINSLHVGLWVAALNVLLGIGAAYAIACIHFRGRRKTLYAILATRVIPDIALVVPLFLLLRNLGVIDTRAGLVLTYLAVTLPFTVFILIGYFESIPVDLGRAARIDGCSHLRVIRHVYLPLAMPAVVASLMFAFLTSWNEFVLALMLTQTIAAQTLPIVISGFVLDFTVSFSFINAAGVVAIVPPVVLAVLFERYITGGLTAGSVKG